MNTSKRLRATLALAMGICALAFGVAPAYATFGIEPGTFETAVVGEDGNDLTQAGGRPDGTTSFSFSQIEESPGKFAPDDDVKDIRVQLPVGFLGNPGAIERCNGELFSSYAECPPETQVGYAILHIAEFQGFPPKTEYISIYNLVPQNGKPAQFGFAALQSTVPILIDVSVRPTDRGI